jgi:hypothetical protein
MTSMCIFYFFLQEALQWSRTDGDDSQLLVLLIDNDGQEMSKMKHRAWTIVLDQPLCLSHLFLITSLMSSELSQRHLMLFLQTPFITISSAGWVVFLRREFPNGEYSFCSPG